MALYIEAMPWAVSAMEFMRANISVTPGKRVVPQSSDFVSIHSFFDVR